MLLKLLLLVFSLRGERANFPSLVTPIILFWKAEVGDEAGDDEEDDV